MTLYRPGEAEDAFGLGCWSLQYGQVSLPESVDRRGQMLIAIHILGPYIWRIS